MNFKDILETLPTIVHLTGLDVLNGDSSYSGCAR